MKKLKSKLKKQLKSLHKTLMQLPDNQR